ncbi:LEC14B protein-like [Bidens hawaiensis]|uniref:LEC14B protein-like n=1 Tax=Bidens hawaiensis TaxID=980011 RepID=UPI00404AA7E6
MFFRPWNTAIGDMGYALSRLEIDADYSDSESSPVGDENDGPRSSSQIDLDHEVAQLTKLRSSPHERLKRVLGRRDEVTFSPVKMLASREGNYSGRGRFSAADRCHILNKYLPVKGPSIVDQLTTRAYVSQFSNDGSLFVAAFQGSNIKVYNADMGLKLQKNILAKSLRWTVTDTALSPDKRFLVYATMSPIVNILNIESAGTESHANVTEIHEGLEFSGDDEGGYSFGIFSVKFSNDGRELVAGSSDDSIYVYDIEANKLSLRIQAHTSDVNSVCFADETSHLIYSGSDDNLCKVWDRRCLRSRGKPAGILTGHLEGITFLDSRNDGRYFISNGKDQTIKLWDIRKMSSNVTRTPAFRNYEWDYRWMDYPLRARDVKHPCDQSVATYKGHSVLRTLIRCYFSPEYSTGQKYIYTGSHDYCVYVYDLVSGAQVARLVHHKSTVRDCSWHPYYPTLVSSSFDGDIAKWEFPGNGENPIPVHNSRSHRRHID